jgi:hypothetical protein
LLKIVVNRQTSQRQLVDYAVALALLLEISVLYGSFKLATKLGLVHIQGSKVAEASMLPVKREEDFK